MHRLRLRQLWTGSAWHQNLEWVVNSQGEIVEWLAQPTTQPATEIPGVALPGMINLHSHAFQRGFTGLTEFRANPRDSFWTWRDQMFRFLEQLSPESMFRLARQVYTEMRNQGYTWVGEFHYVHTDQGGTRYREPFVMAQAVQAAAAEVGIGLCLIPVLYQRGGFRDEPLHSGQQRFELTATEFIDLVEFCAQGGPERGNYRWGWALHSLRAVAPAVAKNVVAELRARYPEAPVHIHVAEQVGEIEACLAVHGRRSVEFLLENFPVDEHWCLIHATHLTAEERRDLIASRAVAGLCPTTEGSLGDGIFPATEYLRAGGAWGIGTDSQISIDFREELRWLEYNQRLARQERVLLGSAQESVGCSLYRQAGEGGRQALGLRRGPLQLGSRADLTIVDDQHPAIGGVAGERLVDRLIFCNQGNPVLGAVIGGKWWPRPLE